MEKLKLQKLQRFEARYVKDHDFGKLGDPKNKLNTILILVVKAVALTINYREKNIYTTFNF